MRRQRRGLLDQKPAGAGPLGTGGHISPLAEPAAGWKVGFQSAFDQAAIGMALIGLDGVWLRANSALCRLLGYSEQELAATNFQQLTFTGFEGLLELHPRGAQTLRVEYTGLAGSRDVAPGAISKYVFNYPIHNGQIVWQGPIGEQLVARTRIGVIERYARDPYAIWDASVTRSKGRVRPFLQFTNLTDTVYEEVVGVVMPKRGVVGGVELRLYGETR